MIAMDNDDIQWYPLRHPLENKRYGFRFLGLYRTEVADGPLRPRGGISVSAYQYSFTLHSERKVFQFGSFWSILFIHSFRFSFDLLCDCYLLIQASESGPPIHTPLFMFSRFIENLF